jgi:hypothetical protein
VFTLLIRFKIKKKGIRKKEGKREGGIYYSIRLDVTLLVYSKKVSKRKEGKKI